jgi:hypothetical protein
MDYDSLVSNLKEIRHVTEYVVQTGLLGQLREAELDGDNRPEQL